MGFYFFSLELTPILNYRRQIINHWFLLQVHCADKRNLFRVRLWSQRYQLSDLTSVFISSCLEIRANSTRVLGLSVD